MQRAFLVRHSSGLQETLVFNAAEATAYGFELEGSFLFTEKWTGRFNVGYIDSEYDEFLLDTDFDGTPETDLSDRPLSRAPEWQFGADITYDTPLGNIGNLRAQAGVYYQDENTYYYATAPEHDTFIESYTLVDAFVTYTHSSDKWYFSIFGKNLTDELYHSASQYVGGLWTHANYAPPRTYGAEIGINL
jgi:iron complex outermembrane receptor protein